jgi:hypothetical protein
MEHQALMSVVCVSIENKRPETCVSPNHPETYLYQADHWRVVVDLQA